MKLWFVIFGILASHLIEARPNSEEDDVATNNGDSVARKSDAIKSRVKRQAINEDLMDYFPMEDMDEMDGPDVNVDVNVNIKSGGVADVGINVNVESGGDDGDMYPDDDDDDMQSCEDFEREYCPDCGNFDLTVAGLKNSEQRIVGGEPADPHEYPYQIKFIVTKDGEYQSSCGGSIIKKKWILTAAHCLVNSDGSVSAATDVVVHYGNSDFNKAREVRCVNVIVHEGYDDFTVENDIALIEIETEFDFENDATVQAICIAEEGDNPFNGGLAVASGYGDMVEGATAPLPTDLQEVTLEIINMTMCNIMMDLPTNDAGIICAFTQGKDTCTGDSGGPLVTRVCDRWVLIGATSWGNGCARDTPGVYARVSYYREWIYTKTGSSMEC